MFCISGLPVKTFPKLRCQNIYKPFKSSHCMLGISVGKAAHESLKLYATLAKVNEAFASCTLCVGDTLQRFTLALEGRLSPSELYLLSKQKGDEWLKRNEKFYTELEIPYQIRRWDYYLYKPQFNIYKKQVLGLLESRIDCQHAFNQTVEMFLKRNIYDCKYVKAKRYCIDYLVEECAVMFIWVDEGYDYEAYPARKNPAMEYIYQNLIVPKHKNAITNIYIKSVNYMY